MKKLIKNLLVISVLLVLPVMVFAATPQFPHLFYGDITINGASAPIGTVVIAKVGEVEKGRITTTIGGKYGGPGAYEQKLLVQGNIAPGIAPGATITFSTAGHNGTPTALFTSEKMEKLDLTFNFEIPPTPPVVPPPNNNGGGGGSTGGGNNSGTSPTFKIGDANHDGRVDILDFNLLMVNWGSLVPNNIADFNRDGRVDILDFNLLMVNWGL
jgi:hypothetical protein